MGEAITLINVVVFDEIPIKRISDLTAILDNFAEEYACKYSLTFGDKATYILFY
jgi:hypothetical protein